MDFDQTYTKDTLWDKEECFTFCGQKINGQGHGGTIYPGNSSLWAAESTTQCSAIQLAFLVCHGRQFFTTAIYKFSVEISSWICQIWQMPVQLQYAQLITH